VRRRKSCSETCCIAGIRINSFLLSRWTQSAGVDHSPGVARERLITPCRLAFRPLPTPRHAKRTGPCSVFSPESEYESKYKSYPRFERAPQSGLPPRRSGVLGSASRRGSNGTRTRRKPRPWGRRSQGFRNSLTPRLTRNHRDGLSAYGAEAESLCHGQEQARRPANDLSISLT
jgi:hypothetical protein